jgi:hypothetical protein
MIAGRGGEMIRDAAGSLLAIAASIALYLPPDNGTNEAIGGSEDSGEESLMEVVAAAGGGGEAVAVPAGTRRLRATAVAAFDRLVSELEEGIEDMLEAQGRGRDKDKEEEGPDVSRNVEMDMETQTDRSTATAVADSSTPMAMTAAAETAARLEAASSRVQVALSGLHVAAFSLGRGAVVSPWIIRSLPPLLRLQDAAPSEKAAVTSAGRGLLAASKYIPLKEEEARKALATLTQVGYLYFYLIIGFLG